MKGSAIVAVLFCCLISMLKAATGDFGKMTAICQVSFTAKTQMGEIPCHIAVCHLESDLGSGSSLYIVTAFDREYSPAVERILEVAHSPVIEKKNDQITILYTTGANTTCVTEFSVAGGILKYESTETIAWNDQGTYRRSATFPRYSRLLQKRDLPNKPAPAQRP